MELNKLITDEQLNASFEGTNFGNHSNRDIIKFTLLKCASAYHAGSTAKYICRNLKLITHKNWILTKLGKRYLYEAFKFKY